MSAATPAPASAPDSKPIRKWYRRRWFRWIAYSLGSLLLLILIFLGVASWYISSHKAEILARITKEASESIHGKVIIGDVSPSLFADFPFASLVLSDVHIQDSAYGMHHHELLQADEIFLRISTTALLRKKLNISRLTVSNAAIYLFTDSTGYSNTDFLKNKEKTGDEKKTSVALKRIALRNVSLRFVHAIKQKDFRLLIDGADIQTKKKGDDWQIRADVHTHIGGLAFNTTRGAYLEKAELRGNISGNLSDPGKVLKLEAPALRLDGEKIAINASFDFGDTAHNFSLRLEGKDLTYSKALNWVTPIISSKLKLVDFKKPVSAVADIRGHMKYRDTPNVVVRWVAQDNVFSTPAGDFEQCSFRGAYSNQARPLPDHTDANSIISITDFHGLYSSIPLEIDSATISNLLRPVLDAYVRSAFDLNVLNDLEGSPIQFKGGRAEAKFHFYGGLARDDNEHPPVVNGSVRIQDGSFMYLPRSVPVGGLQALLEMQGDNLYLRNVSLGTPGGAVTLEGAAEHFFRFYFSQPGLVNITFRAASPNFDLAVLRAFAGTRRQVSNGAGSARTRSAVLRTARQLDKVLDECTIHLLANFGRLHFGPFVATNVKTDARLSQGSIALRNVSLNHAGGSVALQATLGQGGKVNPLSLSADINNVVVNELFEGTNNFGQDAILADNIRGRISAKTQVSARMKADGTLLPNSLQGRASFVLEKGALKNFEPLMKISKYVFKNRGLDNITFEKLEDELMFRNGAIIIQPLLIESSAFNMRIAGVYNPPNGTDIAITLPLGNPNKGNQRWKKKGKIGPGLTINLRATDGPNNKVRIGWDVRKNSSGLEDTISLNPAPGAGK